MSIEFKTAFHELCSPRGLSATSTRQSFEAIFAGSWQTAQIAAFLGSLRVRGESAEQIAAAATAMREVLIPVTTKKTRVLDTCGTGGDGLSTLNLSTTSAIVCAAAGATVAKHGNRAVSSSSGSADVLESLGITIDLEAVDSGQLLDELGIAFLMATKHHPAMKFAGPVRRELGVRTIFNCLGPLTNPASATIQIVGTYSNELRPIMANTLRLLGSESAWIVRGENGIDELNPDGATAVSELKNGLITEKVVFPEDFGLQRTPLDSIQGGDSKENAKAMLDLLKGGEHRSKNAVLLNAGAALHLYFDELPNEAVARAKQAIDSGKAMQLLTQWIKRSTELKQASEAKSSL